MNSIIACLFCGDSENIQKHHVCWSSINVDGKKRYKPRSWNASLTVPLCKSCREIYHKSSNKENFISKIPDKEKQEIIRKNFDSAQSTIEDAIRMSYLIPIVNYTFCGKEYSYIKTVYPSLDDLLIKVKEKPLLLNQVWGKTSIWGIKTKKYLDKLELEILTQFTTEANSKKYEYVHKKILKLLSNYTRRNVRSSREAIINYIIQHRRKKQPIGEKIEPSEIDYALCRMVANKELTMEPEYLSVIVKPIVYYKGAKEPKRELKWIMYYMFKSAP